MIFNPAKYFLKRYHSPDLQPKELRRMLNLWFPFLVNRIQIISITEDFHEMQVRLNTLSGIEILISLSGVDPLRVPWIHFSR